MAFARLSDKTMLAMSRWNRGRKAHVLAEFIRRHGVSSDLIVGCGEGCAPDIKIIEATIARLVPFRMAIDRFFDNSPGPVALRPRERTGSAFPSQVSTS